MENNFNKENQNRGLVRRDRGDMFFEPFFDDFFGFPSMNHEMRHFDRLLKTDVKEDENGYSLEIETPGVKRENINLDMNNGYLTVEIKQDNTNEEKDKKGNYIRRERYSGTVTRSYYVGDVKEEDISAKLDQGVLHIEIPKDKKQETKKRIEIK